MKRWMGLLVILSTVVAACGDDDDAPAEPAGSGLRGSITVSAAASLTDAFTALGEDFSTDNPGVDVEFNFDSSTALADQLLEGAPADVFASADEGNMIKLTVQGVVADGEPEIFARNQLVIVTKPGNPEGVRGLADLADVGVVSLCGAEVPCGRFAAHVLGEAGVSIPESSVTRGQNARATLAAVAEGDAVAGLVYVTDAESAGDAVKAVEIPAGAIAEYPIAVLAASENAAAANAFVELVVGDRGRAILEEHGFLLPPA